MPVKKVKGGYRWGNSGKVYKTRSKQSVRAELYMPLAINQKEGIQHEMDYEQTI